MAVKMKTNNEEIARELLSIGAVFFRPNEPFVWASGIKSPVYCDNRLILTAPEVREKVESAMEEMIRQNFPDVQALFGTSTAGIAHAAIIAYLMDLPMGYVRGEVKDHGRKNRIEGKLEPGQKVVVVEDLISTAGSAIDTAKVLREEGAEVLGIASIFTYNMKKGLDNLRAAGLKNVSLCDFEMMTKTALQENYITAEDRSTLLAFLQNNPAENGLPGENQWIF